MILVAKGALKELLILLANKNALRKASEKCHTNSSSGLVASYP